MLYLPSPFLLLLSSSPSSLHARLDPPPPPSSSSSVGSRLATQCGLITTAAYFPGFHETPDNNNFWGKGWTEWDNLANLSWDPVANHSIRHPLQTYDLLDLSVIFKQAELAKKYGLGAFMFYTYWFGFGRKTLNLPLENAFLNSKERLGIKFFFSWANEPWSNRWERKAKGASIDQIYGNSFEWKRHFDYLQPFFEHPDYLQIDGKPVFVIYRPDLIQYSKYSEEDEYPVQLKEEDLVCPGPGGCVASRLYVTWYEDLVNLNLTSAYDHWETIGRAEGRSWPQVEESESEAEKEERSQIMKEIGHRNNLLEQMIRFWQSYAIQKGFKNGIYIVGTLSHAVRPSLITKRQYSILDAAVQFLPTGISKQPTQCGKKPANRSCECYLKHAVDFTERYFVPKSSLHLHRGAFPMWSNYPRHRYHVKSTSAYCSNPSGPAFQELLEVQLSRSLKETGGCKSPQTGSISRFLLINAWNEWGEQASIEPNSVDGDMFLRHHANAVSNIERVYASTETSTLNQSRLD